MEKNNAKNFKGMIYDNFNNNLDLKGNVKRGKLIKKKVQRAADLGD